MLSPQVPKNEILVNHRLKIPKFKGHKPFNDLTDRDCNSTWGMETHLHAQRYLYLDLLLAFSLPQFVCSSFFFSITLLLIVSNQWCCCCSWLWANQEIASLVAHSVLIRSCICCAYFLCLHVVAAALVSKFTLFSHLWRIFSGIVRAHMCAGMISSLNVLS